MTSKEALEKSIELWEWLAEDGRRGKCSPGSPVLIEKPISGCYLCDFTTGGSNKRVLTVDCTLCPMKDRWWGIDGKLCEVCFIANSIYDKWNDLDIDFKRDDKDLYDIEFFAKLMAENMQEVLDEI